MKPAFFAVLFLALLVPSQVFAQFRFVPLKRVEYYKKETEQLKKLALLDSKIFDKMYHNKKTGKVLTFVELPIFEKDLLQLGAMEAFERALHKQQQDWLEASEALSEVENEKLSQKDSDVANRTDVLHYRNEILSLHKELVGRYEGVAKAFFDRHPNRFSREESSNYLAQIAKIKERK